VLRDTFPAESGTDSFFLKLSDVGDAEDPEAGFTLLKQALDQLPPDRRAILGEVVRFGQELTEYSSKTNMSANSIARMLQPGIISHTDIMTEANNSAKVQKAVEVMMARSDELWPRQSASAPSTSGSQ
jgi:hypothetical protein